MKSADTLCEGSFPNLSRAGDTLGQLQQLLGLALGWKLRRMICHLGQEFLEPTIPYVAAPIMRTHLWRGAWPATSGLTLIQRGDRPAL